MLSLSFIGWAAALIAAINLWWQSDKVKSYALSLVASHCKNKGLQLLDQTLVLISLKPARNSAGSLQMRRCYRFEFASTGEQRYKGEVVLFGRTLQTLELEAHIIPTEQEDF